MKRSPFSKFNLRFALRINKHGRGDKFVGSSSEMDGTSRDTTGLSRDRIGGDRAKDGQSFERHSDIVPIADNPDVWKVQFKKRGMTKLKRTLVRVRRVSRRVMKFLAVLKSDKLSGGEKARMLITLREWKPEDLDEHRRQNEERRLFVFHKQQAKLLEAQVVEILSNLGFCFKVTKDDRVYIKKRVKIARVDVSPYAYVYHIKAVPYGVKKTDMSQDWVATEIASSIGKKVRHELDLFGLRYTVEIGSTLSVPNFASFSDFGSMPKNQPPLAFYLGQTTNGAPVYRNLADAPHMIVAGQTGGGKSNLLNGIICGYLLRQPPSTVKFILFDLKGGVEFDSFYGVPHLWRGSADQDGIIEYPEQIIPALTAILEETNRRLVLLKRAKKKNIAELNRGKHESNRLPYLIGIFDEYTTARKLAGDKVETLLSTIANLSRAAGIHFIIGTQYPKAEILSTLISVNFPWRIAFNMSAAASQSVLGSWDAVGLTPVGRALFQSSDGQVYVQTPRITSSTIDSIVESVKSGATTITVSSVDAEEILEWAMNNTGGKLDRDTLFNQFKEKITVAALNDLLRSMEDKQFEVQGTLYVVRPQMGNQARRMELVEGSREGDGTNDKQQTTVTRDGLVTEEK
jgi:hypothetical protein